MALVDTGAARSCVSASFVRRLGLRPESSALRLSTANNNAPIRIKGEVTLVLQARETSFPPWQFVVVSDLMCDVIVGADLMVATGAAVDMGQSLVRVGESVIPLLTTRSDDRHSTVSSMPADRKRSLGKTRSSARPPMSATMSAEAVPAPPAARQRKLPAVEELIDDETLARKLASGDTSQENFDESLPILDPSSKLDPLGPPIAVEDLIASAGAAEPILVANLERLLLKNQAVFSRDPKKPGTTSEVEHVIRLRDPNRAPVRAAPRRLNPEKTAELEKQVREMLDNGIIRKSHSEWSSGVVLVKKSDGSLRFCVDYRGLNERCEPDRQPVPIIDDILHRLTGAKYFSTMDLSSGYWQVKLNKESIPMTAFATPTGLYELCVGAKVKPGSSLRLLASVELPIFVRVSIYWQHATIKSLFPSDTRTTAGLRDVQDVLCCAPEVARRRHLPRMTHRGSNLWTPTRLLLLPPLALVSAVLLATAIAVVPRRRTPSRKDQTVWLSLIHTYITSPTPYTKIKSIGQLNTVSRLVISYTVY